jgi:hypothetical protein
MSKLGGRTKDLTGQTFSGFTVTGHAGYTDQRKPIWHVMCQHGHTFQTTTPALTRYERKHCPECQKSDMSFDYTLPVAVLARQRGLPLRRVHGRLRRGWTIEEALS